LVDTGSSSTFLNKDSIGKLGCKSTETQQIVLANGAKVNSKVYKLKMKNFGMKDYIDVLVGELSQNILGRDYMNIFGVKLSFDMESIGLNINNNCVDNYDEDNNSLYFIQKIFKDDWFVEFFDDTSLESVSSSQPISLGNSVIKQRTTDSSFIESFQNPVNTSFIESITSSQPISLENSVIKQRTTDTSFIESFQNPVNTSFIESITSSQPISLGNSVIKQRTTDSSFIESFQNPVNTSFIESITSSQPISLENSVINQRTTDTSFIESFQNPVNTSFIESVSLEQPVLFKSNKISIVCNVFNQFYSNEIELNSKIFGFCKIEPIKLEFKKSSENFFIKQYNLDYFYLELINNEIKHLLSMGIIEKVKFSYNDFSSNYNSPIFMVRKGLISDQKFRMVIDLRKINSNLMDDCNYLPRLEDIFNKIISSGEGIFFAKIDLSQAFNQLMIHEDSRKFLRFSNPASKVSLERYQFVGAPFGLKILPSKFQLIIQSILEETNIKNLGNFIDDIFLFEKDLNLLNLNIKKVIIILNKYNLKMNINKCVFGTKELILLGYILENNTLKIDKSRILKFLDEENRPSTGKEIKRFLGFLNFFRSHIPNFAEVTWAFESLRNINSFEWTNYLEEKLVIIKQIFCDAKVINFPDFSKEFSLYTDASINGLGATLKQGNEFIGFFSRSIKKSETNFSVIKKELIAIVNAMMHFKQYLIGHKFLLYSDNKSLSYVLDFMVTKERKNSEFLKNFIFNIQRFNFRIIYLDGSKNKVADSLSRINYVDKVSNSGKSNLHDIILKAHSMGHYGLFYLTNYLSQVLDLKLSVEDIDFCKKTVEECKLCKYFNSGKRGFAPIVNFQASYPMENICIDLLVISNKKTSKGNVALLVVLDVFTKFTWLIPIKSKSSLEVAEALERIVCEFGFFSKLSSDNGKEVNNSILKFICDKFKVEHQFSAPYYHEGNGAVERANRNILNVIFKICFENLCNIKEWDRFIYVTAFCVNQRISSITLSSGFSLMFGRNAWNENQLFDLNKNRIKNYDILKEEDNNKLIIQLKNNWLLINKFIFPELNANISLNLEKKNEKINKKRLIRIFKPNDIVFVKYNIISSVKSVPRFIGPLIIMEKIGLNFNIGSKDGTLVYEKIPTSHLIISKFKKDDILSDLEIEKFIEHAEGELVTVPDFILVNDSPSKLGEKPELRRSKKSKGKPDYVMLNGGY
jgi:predicted aspartyl protease